MTRCALLLRPSANRVYGAAAPGLALAELALLDDHVLGGVLADPSLVELGGVPYLLVDHDGPLAPHTVEVLSNLSGLHALFEV